jgi:hypothetical protein
VTTYTNHDRPATQNAAPPDVIPLQLIASAERFGRTARKLRGQEKWSAYAGFKRYVAWAYPRLHCRHYDQAVDAFLREAML